MRSARDKSKKTPQKCWIDNIKEDCGTLGMTITQVSKTAQDRNNWKTTINQHPGMLKHCWDINDDDDDDECTVQKMPPLYQKENGLLLLRIRG